MEQTIALFGATGKTGKLILELGASKYSFKCLVRDESKFQSILEDMHSRGIDVSRIQYIVGDARNLDDVRDTIQLADYAINTIAPVYGARSQYDISYVATKNIVKAIEQNYICKKLFVMSGAFGTEYQNYNNIFGRIYVFLFLRDIYKFKKLEDHYLKNSEIDWTIVRAGMLVDSNIPSDIEIIPHRKLGLFEVPRTSRINVAQYILNNLDNPDLKQEAIMIFDR